MRDSERLYRYVERYFGKSGNTEFPTVRRVARALRWTQDHVELTIGDDERLMLTSYFTSPEPLLGEHFVESLGELRQQPPGRAPKLTAAQEAGLEDALASMRRGEGIPATEARAKVRALVADRRRAGQKKSK